MNEGQLHTLEFLLAFNRPVQWYGEDYFTKFDVKRAVDGRTACAIRSRCMPRKGHR